jgi:hypothetical protein
MSLTERDARAMSLSYEHKRGIERPDLLRKERARQIRGLVLLAVAVLVFAVLRAGVHRVFGPGWWRLW